MEGGSFVWLSDDKRLTEGVQKAKLQRRKDGVNGARYEA